MQKYSLQKWSSHLKPEIPKYREPDGRNAKESTIAINFHSSCGEESSLKEKNVENFADVLRCTWPHVQINSSCYKSESLSFYRPLMFCPFRSPQCVVRLRLSIQLVREPLKIWSHYRVPSILMQSVRSCDHGLSLKGSFTSCSEAQVKPGGCPSLIWSSTGK